MSLMSSLERLNRDSLPHFLRIAAQQSRQIAYTFISYLLASWWQVQLGKECTFVGLPRFRRAPRGAIRIGQGCRFLSKFDSNQHGLNRPCMISVLRYGASVQIGDNVGMSGTVIAAATKVTIGSRVMCGANTTITDTDSHSLDYRQRHPVHFSIDRETFPEEVMAEEIVIGDDVFLGMNVVVLKGVTIGRGTVVGAGSVVSKSLPDKVIAVGQRTASSLARRLHSGPERR